MNNLTKLHKIKELINCSFTNLPINEREELNDYIKILIKIEEFTPEYTTIEPI
tara:strand:+ start:384 stop:542 length:159 start_codon:yes stop_codon:yes gene_type:complete